ncbi:MAG: flippase-like domain-containing protein [Planctomycetes bacterium]|nr:flippase-like domain-containing protein [Planctomycetota bacterium]
MAPDVLSQPPNSPDLRRRVWTLLKWTLCLAVLVFVARRGWELWTAGDVAVFDFRFEWLLPAIAIYWIGWLPSVWFWRRLMRRFGTAAQWHDCLRAYYCGHLGKYVPGKATVVVIRAGLLRDRGVPVTVSALSAACETILMMAAGAAIGAALSPLLFSPAQTALWPEWMQRLVAVPILPAAAVVAACLVLSPIVAHLLSLAAVRTTPRGMTAPDRAVAVGPSLVPAGLVLFAAGWAAHGLSLGLVLHSLGTSFDLAHWPLWTGAVALSTAVGFAVLFAPGGIGVREGVLIETLSVQPEIGPQRAVAAAVLLRAAWFAAEILAAGGLYWLLRPGTQGPPSFRRKDAEDAKVRKDEP